MKSKLINILIFVLSAICLIISVKLFYNMAFFADEFNTSPAVVTGGEFWLLMDWVRLGLSACICLLSGMTLLSKK